MESLNGKTAVITGAGSGFGREFARACAKEGMRLVLADLRRETLDETCALPELQGCEVLAQACDVSKSEQVDALAAAAEARFGKLHLIFNNAGVAASGPLWTATADEWNWVLGVNLLGVANGVRAFVPRLLAHGEPAHVVNTASIAGMVSGAGQGIYCASKHAVVALSEVLHHELRMVGSKVGVSVLCPAFAPTGIADSNRHRPAEFAARNAHPMAQAIEDMARKAVAKGRISAEAIAAQTLRAVRENRFYILPHEKTKLAVEGRMRHILDGLAPHDPMTSQAF